MFLQLGMANGTASDEFKIENYKETRDSKHVVDAQKYIKIILKKISNFIL